MRPGPAQPPPAPTEAELKALTLRELGRPMGVLLRLRWVMVSADLALVGFFLLGDPSTWRAWLLAATGAAIGLLAAWDHRRKRVEGLGPRAILSLIASVWGIHTAIIVVTGGIESPFILLYMPVAAVAGTALGDLSLLAVLLGAQLVTVWTLATVASLADGPLLVPALLHGGLTSNPAWRWTISIVATFVLPVAATFGLRIRAALDRAVMAAAHARHEALESMRERNRALLDLSGALAHELKNPLASISGLSSLLARKLPESGREAEQMGVLQGEVRRMAAIVEEFLNFSRPVQALTLREIAASKLVEEVIVLHEGAAIERGVTLAGTCGPGVSCRCDPRKLKQILGNLVGNALEATPRGGRVELRASEQDGARVVFEVEDTGVGLADAVRSRLFTAGATTKALGSGLGLVIARAIAEQHGGTLVLADRDCGGCVARVELPCDPPVEAPVEGG